MGESYNNHDVLRYCRQVVLKAMDNARASMRGSDRLSLRSVVGGSGAEKLPLNLTKGTNVLAEEHIVATPKNKPVRRLGIHPQTVFSEEIGIRIFPEGASEHDAEFVVFIDPIDGTEFIESLQRGWCVVAVYDRRADEVVCAVAEDIFFNRLHWASRPSE